MAFLCVDVGGTNTLIGLGNGDFGVLRELKTKKFLSKPGETLEEVIERSDHTRDEVDRVAVAVAGPMDREEGVFYPPNIDSMEKVQILDPMAEFGEVTIINDCTSAVAGEYFYGDKSCDDMVYLTISSGIGAGAIVDGELVEGWNGNVGEVGHLVVGTEGVECGCGGTDHWEAYCSGNGMPEMAEEVFDADFSSSVEVFEKFREGDDDARRAIEKMQSYNASGFANVVNVFNPEVVWIGGAVALNHYDTVVEGVLPEVEDQAVNEMPEFKRCSLGEEAVVHGLRAACNDLFEVS